MTLQFAVFGAVGGRVALAGGVLHAATGGSAWALERAGGLDLICINHTPQPREVSLPNGYRTTATRRLPCESEETSPAGALTLPTFGIVMEKGTRLKIDSCTD